jgi:hypothetical protein
MKYGKLINVVLTICIAFGLATPPYAGAQAIIADHNGVTEFYSIPLSYIQDIQNNCRIFYGHTSHGSQIVTGINMLEDEDAAYEGPVMTEYGSDLGHNGDVSWVVPTRTYLNAHPECNVVMWSWCGGASDNTEAGINIYLDSMNALEAAYPAVDFIYMTGHLDGSGPAGDLYRNNNQIRNYCLANGKILFDFADIESYDPDGVYYPDETDACYWCYDWCAVHTCPDCGSCAHSHCFNCYQKGKAFWWMMAKARGWNEVTGCCDEWGTPGDANADHDVNLLDILWLISYKYNNPPGPGSPIGCNELLNADGNGGIDLVDILWLIGYKYNLPPGPAPVCP